MIEWFHHLPWQAVGVWELVNSAVSFCAGLYLHRKELRQMTARNKRLEDELAKAVEMGRKMQNELRLWWYKYAPDRY